MLRERILGTYPNERREVLGTQAEVLASPQPDGVYGICEDTGAEIQWFGGQFAAKAPLSFSGIGTDVPQPGVGYGPVISVGGITKIRDPLGGYSIDGIPTFSTITGTDPDTSLYAWAALHLTSLTPNLSKAKIGTTAEMTWIGPLATDWYSKKGRQILKLAVGSNLMPSINSVTGGYVSRTDGSIISGGAYNVSDWIPVSPGEKYLCVAGDDTLTQYGGCYDANKTWIAELKGFLTKPDGSPSPSGPSGTRGLFYIPANCYWIRINRQVSWIYPHFIYKYDDSFSRLRHTRFNSISCIGDSIAHGYYTEKAWWKIFGEMAGATVFNDHGIGSSTIASPGTSPMNERLSSIIPADCIVFEGGYNDWANGGIPLGVWGDSSNTTFYGALKICAEYMAGAFPLSMIVWYAIPRPYGWATIRNGVTFDSYINALKETAQKYGFCLVDHYNEWSQYRKNEFLSADRVHPGTLGSGLSGMSMYNQLLG